MEDCVFKAMGIPRPRHGHKWGRWMFNGQTLTLQCFMEGNDEFVIYEVDLDRCIDAPSIFDWVLQIAGKTWATPDDIGNLVLALNQLAGDGLQGMVCPWGKATSEHMINYQAILK